MWDRAFFSLRAAIRISFFCGEEDVARIGWERGVM